MAVGGGRPVLLGETSCGSEGYATTEEPWGVRRVAFVLCGSTGRLRGGGVLWVLLVLVLLLVGDESKMLESAGGGGCVEVGSEVCKASAGRTRSRVDWDFFDFDAGVLRGLLTPLWSVLKDLGCWMLDCADSALGAAVRRAERLRAIISLYEV